MNPAAATPKLKLLPGLVVSSLAIGCALWWAISAKNPQTAGGILNAASPRNIFDGAIIKIGIDIDERELKSLRKSPRKYVRATVIEGGEVYPDASVRLKGSIGSFRPVDDKPALTVNFHRHGAARSFHRLSQIHLNNSVEDPSFLNEQIGGEIFAAAGVPAPRATRAFVELNGRPLGVYTLVEGYTGEFLAAAFKRGDGALYDPEVGHDVDRTMKLSGSHDTDADETDLEDLAAACADPNLRRRWERLEQNLDMDRFASFMAVEVMLGHRDGYCMARNNYRIYHDPDADKMVFLPHGMDQLFGKADLTWKPTMAGTVAHAVIETPEGQRLYEERFRGLFSRVFQLSKLNERIDQLVGAARSGLTSAEFKALETEALALQARIARRRMSLEEQLAKPELTLTLFTDRAAPLGGWTVSGASETGALAKTVAPDGSPALLIAADRAAGASWRAKALLKRGSYRFEGRACVAGVKPIASIKRGGASIRVAGSTRACDDLSGDTAWRPLAAPFQVNKETEQVELVCELQASAGRAWFALGSLRLVEVP
jgi:hypothetical protein